MVIRSKAGSILGIIGSKPPHMQKDEERKQPLKYEDMFIDIGAKSKEEALKMVTAIKGMDTIHINIMRANKPESLEYFIK